MSRPTGRLRRVASHLAPPAAAATASRDMPSLPPRPEGRSDVRPTTDAAVALADFTREGFCLITDVLTPAEVTLYKEHLLGVMGDRRYLDASGSRTDPATARFTEPTVLPASENRSQEDPSRFPLVNRGQGSAYHNGDFTAAGGGVSYSTGVYGDELRLGVEGYIRHDPRWAELGCEKPAVRAVIDPLLGSDFRVVYTDGFVEYPGAKALAWHSDGPHLNFGGHSLDASPRITSLWMLSDFTKYNGGTWVVPGSHKLEVGEDHPVTVWSEEEKASFHPDAVAAEAPAGSVLLFDCRLYHTKAPNDTDTERLAVQVRYGAGWYYTRLNHSGHSGGGGPALPPSVLEQMPATVRPRFEEY